MSSPDINKTSEELANEVHGQIDRIGANIEHVRTRLSPGNLLDDAIFYPHGQSISGAYGHMKNNPMGSMFLSLGTLLLMEDEQNRSYETIFKERASETGHAISEKSSEWKDKAKANINAARESIRSATNELRSKTDSAKEDLMAGARELEGEAETASQRILNKAKTLKDKSMEKLSSARESAKEGWQSAKSNTQDRIESARERINNSAVLEQAMHPYAIASMGLGIGASLGASMSMPQIEQRLNTPEFNKRAEELGNDFDFAIKEAGDRLKNHLIDELKQFNFH